MARRRKSRRRRSRRRNPVLKALVRSNRGRRRRHNGVKRNPLILANRRHGRRRSRRRNAVTYFNPGRLGGIVGKVTGKVRALASVSTLKQGAATAVGVAAAWALPARLLPLHDSGLKGLALSGVLGAVGATVLGMALPALAPAVWAGVVGGTVLKAMYMYGRGILPLPSISGLGAFLTLGNRGVGQIPSNLIAGGRLGDFLETKGAFTAVGPTRSAALGGGERFSSVV